MSPSGAVTPSGITSPVISYVTLCLLAVKLPVNFTSLSGILNLPAVTVASVVVQPENVYPSALRFSFTVTSVPYSTFVAPVGAVTPSGIIVPVISYVTLCFFLVQIA